MTSSTIEDAVNAYTDGSCLYKPARLGGAAFRIVTINSQGDEESVDVPLLGFKGSTNNEMELYACIAAIEEAQTHPYYERLKKIAIHTDSTYVQVNYDRARYNWSQHKWHNRNGRPILNARLWQDLLKAIRDSGYKVRFHWIKGHASDPHNRAADRLARASAKAAILPPLSRVNVRRKITAESVSVGSVGLTGQRLTDQYLELPRCFKYKYEVLTKGSPHFGKVDIIFSQIPLGAGHKYYVLVNDDTKNPTIRKVIREMRK
jgi:ribonuclease HI